MGSGSRNDTGVRRAAVLALAEYYRGDPGDLATLVGARRCKNKGLARVRECTPCRRWRSTIARMPRPCRSCRVCIEVKILMYEVPPSRRWQNIIARMPNLAALVGARDARRGFGGAKCRRSALAEHYSENTETLSLLRERAVKVNDSDVRSAAVLALIEHYERMPGPCRSCGSARCRMKMRMCEVPPCRRWRNTIARMPPTLQLWGVCGQDDSPKPMMKRKSMAKSCSRNCS